MNAKQIDRFIFRQTSAQRLIDSKMQLDYEYLWYFWYFMKEKKTIQDTVQYFELVY